MKKSAFLVSFRCFYEDGNRTNHRQELKLSEIQKWIEAYKFTHPACTAISCKIWFDEPDKIDD